MAQNRSFLDLMDLFVELRIAKNIENIENIELRIAKT